MGKRVRCQYCFSRPREDGSICQICGIDSLKEKSALTPTEKKIAYRCRTLYTIGFLSIIAGFVGLFLVLPSFIFFTRGQVSRNALARPGFLLIFYVTINLFLPVFGFALRRFQKWCYPAGIVLYASFIFVNLLDFHVGPVIFALFFLYWIASPPSREILSRSDVRSRPAA